jgi:hypothetical protein
MAELVYALCAVTSTFCAVLLIRAFRSTRQRLLLWSSVGFAGFAVNNVLVFLDLVIVPATDLSLPRNLAASRRLVAPCRSHLGGVVNTASLNQFLLGGTATACWASGVFFLRFHRATGERLFLYFALALVAFGAHWATLAVVDEPEHWRYLFSIRAVAFLLLIFGIVQKNRGK